MAVDTGVPSSVDGAADKIFSILGDPDGPTGSGEAPQSDEAIAESIANEPEEETPVEVAEVESEEETSEPEAEAEAPIEPPVSWKAEAKERFKALPRELQQVVVERESERDRGLTKAQQEAAEIRKSAQAAEQAASKERETYLDRLNQVIGMAQTMDPILAEGARTDWVKASAQDPAGTQQKWFAYQQRKAQLDALQNERARVMQMQTQESTKKAASELAGKLDFWGDETKRTNFQKEMRSFLASEGFDDNEIRGITDHRPILIARKAMLYDQLMAAQAKIAEQKKAPQPPKKILKSQAPNDANKSGKMESALKQASKISRTDQQAELIARALE